MGLALSGCIPRGAIVASPGDNGDISGEFGNESDSAGDISIQSIRLAGPDFVTVRSTESQLGPAVIAPGESYSYLIKYDITDSAPYGCFRAYTAYALSPDEDGIVDPDPEDDPSPIDFLLVPSTGSWIRQWVKLVSRFRCRARLAETERPDIKARCRTRIKELTAVVEEQVAEPLWFEAMDRTRHRQGFEEVAAAAKSGIVPAVLELGFRPSSDSRKLLTALIRSGMTVESFNRDDLYQCEEKVRAALPNLRSARSAARQALARLGDASLRSAYARDLIGADEGRAEGAVAAWVYIGGREARRRLSETLLVEGLTEARQFAVARALGRLEPAEQKRIQDASSSLQDQLVAWKAWANGLSRPR